MIEGTRLVEEAIRTDQEIHLVLHTAGWGSRNPRLLERLDRRETQIELVTESIMASCSDVEAPQGVLAVLPIKLMRQAKLVSTALILDRLSDPGNLGTLLRTALAASVDCVYLTPGSVDVYNPKVMRAGMGAHFSLVVQEASFDEIISEIEGLDLWTTQARQGQVYHQVDWCKPVALAIGSEAHGLDPGFQSRARGAVHIPIADPSESLNAAVAAAVILFEIKRQRSG